MIRTFVLAAFFLLNACSMFGPGHGDVVADDDNQIKIKIGYEAAVNGVTTRPAAVDHCEDEDKKAVWIGHDRDGNMHYRCE